MRIVSLNLWQGRLTRLLYKTLSDYGADFACMQESVEYDGDSAGMVCENSLIAKSLQTDNRFFTPLASMVFGPHDMHHGNVIFSKLPFEDRTSVFTAGVYNPTIDFATDDYNIRAFQHVIINANNKPLHILNYHGYHIDEHKLGNDITLSHSKKILDYINKLHGGIVLCGDFNLSPDSDSIKIFNESLRNLSVEHNLITTRSALTTKNEVCDYIFVNKKIDVHKFWMDESIISDHNALLLDFEVKD